MINEQAHVVFATGRTQCGSLYPFVAIADDHDNEWSRHSGVLNCGRILGIPSLFSSPRKFSTVWKQAAGVTTAKLIPVHNTVFKTKGSLFDDEGRFERYPV